jgi:hypothetical protein
MDDQHLYLRLFWIYWAMDAVDAMTVTQPADFTR